MSIFDFTRSGPRSSEAPPERPIVVLVGILFMFEASLYSAVTPVLPHYQHVLHASKPAVGVLAGCYSAGLIPGAFLGGWLAYRVGVRRTTFYGLLVFAVAVAAFGFGTNLVALDVLRLIQGVAVGAIWGGALTWVIAVAPRERRGQVIGSVIGAAIFGTLVGPVLGTLAVTVGTELVFTLVGVVALVLAAWTYRHPEPPHRELGPRPPVREMLGNRRLVLGFWLIVLDAITIGALNTLLPLRMAHFNASSVLIGGAFVVASLFSWLVATPVGRVVDRRGPALPLVIGEVLLAGALILLPLPQSAVLLAILTAVVLGPPTTSVSIPGMAILTDAVERAGIAVAIGSMMVNLAWALGETFGAPAAANLSQATSDAVPLVLLAVLNLVTMVAVFRIQGSARIAETDSDASQPVEPEARPEAVDTPARRREQMYI
jgi:MFS family permease